MQIVTAVRNSADSGRRFCSDKRPLLS